MAISQYLQLDFAATKLLKSLLQVAELHVLGNVSHKEAHLLSSSRKFDYLSLSV
jgi:hypothetical protein